MMRGGANVYSLPENLFVKFECIDIIFPNLVQKYVCSDG